MEVENHQLVFPETVESWRRPLRLAPLFVETAVAVYLVGNYFISLAPGQEAVNSVEDGLFVV